jgi:hypothetical protein
MVTLQFILELLWIHEELMDFNVSLVESGLPTIMRMNINIMIYIGRAYFRADLRVITCFSSHHWTNAWNSRR